MYGDVYSTTDLTAYESMLKMSTGSTIFSSLISIFFIVCLWIVFKKAGKPGWASIIPVYNLWILLEISGMKGALSLLILIPILGWIAVCIIELIALFKLARKFGKSDGFGIGLIFLPYIFMAILAFDKSAVYK